MQNIILLYIVFFMLLFSPATKAGEILTGQNISFGLIDLNPQGDVIVIDAKNGTATPQSIRSIVSGGHSGLLTVASSEPVQVSVTYPNSATLVGANNNSLSITDIDLSSEYNGSLINLPGSNTSVDISIGGKLHLPGNTISDSYSGSVIIQLLFL